MAALVVVVFHFLACFAPQVVPDYSSSVPRWVDTPLGLLINGPFAVSIFFVLSGFVLASASSRASAPLWLSVGTRWVRLAAPATVSILLACALLHWMPTASADLDRLVPSPWHAFVYAGTIPSVGDALAEGLWRIFVDMPSPKAFNNVLWTMKFEFIGSIGIYALYRLVPDAWRLRALVAGGVVIVLVGWPMPYVAFALGAVAFELSRRALELPEWASATVLVVGVIAAIPTHGFVYRWHGGSLPWLLRPGESASLFAPFAAFLIVTALIHSRRLARPLVSRAPLFLGTVSFPLYLVHVPIIYTLVCAGVVHFGALSPGRLSVVFACFLAVSILLGWAFELLVDAPLLKALRQLKRMATRGAGRPARHGAGTRA